MRLAGLYTAVALTAAALVTAGFGAAQPPKAVLDLVAPGYAAAMNEIYDDPDPKAPHPGPPPAKMFQRLDLNGDGIADWRVDYEQAYNPSGFCGTGGCRTQLFISRPGGGYVLAFDRVIRVFKPRKVRGEHVLDIDFHGSHCGLTGVEECPRRYGWDETLGRYVERPNKRGETWLPEGPSPVLTTDLATAPTAVRDQIARREALCKAAGGRYPLEEAAVNDLPDLNGDGQRDWLVGATYDMCEMGEVDGAGPALPMVILATTPAGLVVAFEGEVSNWGLELGAPSVFTTVEGEDCGVGSAPCTRVPWRWNGKALVRGG